MSNQEMPFLLAYRWTRQDNPIQYALVYAATEEGAVEKLRAKIANQSYGDMGAKAVAIDISSATLL